MALHWDFAGRYTNEQKLVGAGRWDLGSGKGWGGVGSHYEGSGCPACSF